MASVLITMMIMKENRDREGDENTKIMPMNKNILNNTRT